MTVNATAAQLLSAGTMDLRVTMTDADAKKVMTATPNVTVTIGSTTYPVYEMNPTVVPDVYAVRLTKLTIRHIDKDDPLTFEV